MVERSLYKELHAMSGCHIPVECPIRVLSGMMCLKTIVPYCVRLAIANQLFLSKPKTLNCELQAL